MISHEEEEKISCIEKSLFLYDVSKIPPKPTGAGIDD
jgi:hypothetical protein